MFRCTCLAMLVVAGAVMADFNADKDAYIANMGQSEKNPGQDAEKQAQLLNEYIEENKPANVNSVKAGGVNVVPQTRASRNFSAKHDSDSSQERKGINN